MEIILTNLQEILVSLNDTKKQCLENLNKKITEVSIFQNEIIKIKNLLNSFDNITIAIKNYLIEINTISKFPEAYEVSINEIIRRKNFKNKYIAKINSEIEELTKMYEDEIKKRIENILFYLKLFLYLYVEIVVKEKFLTIYKNIAG